MADASGEPPRWTSALLMGARHGFFGCAGGVSTGQVTGLNCGFGADDDDASVAENRRRAVDAVLPGAPLVAPYQVHSSKAVIVEQPWDDGARPEADAIVTAAPGLLLGIVTADCAPVLLADRDAGIVAAAHAGWRGAHGGVIEASVAAMERLGARASRVVAAIGPTIAQVNYEVDDGFRTRFAEAEAVFFTEGRPGHWQFDLPGYVAHRLDRCGIARIDDLAIDTYPGDAPCFSFRRATHRGAATYGRQLSVIGLSP